MHSTCVVSYLQAGPHAPVWSWEGCRQATYIAPTRLCTAMSLQLDFNRTTDYSLLALLCTLHRQSISWWATASAVLAIWRTGQLQLHVSTDHREAIRVGGFSVQLTLVSLGICTMYKLERNFHFAGIFIWLYVISWIHSLTQSVIQNQIHIYPTYRRKSIQ